MRRRLRLTSRLGSVALAYLLALQTLLGAWSGHAGASTLDAIDPSLTLCRTAAAGETQKSDGGKSSPAHCVVMCLSGACGAADPPATLAVATELLPLRTGAISIRAVAESVAAAAQHIALNARGPPSIG